MVNARIIMLPDTVRELIDYIVEEWELDQQKRTQLMISMVLAMKVGNASRTVDVDSAFDSIRHLIGEAFQ